MNRFAVAVVAMILALPSIGCSQAVGECGPKPKQPSELVLVTWDELIKEGAIACIEFGTIGAARPRCSDTAREYMDALGRAERKNFGDTTGIDIMRKAMFDGRTDRDACKNAMQKAEELTKHESNN